MHHWLPLHTSQIPVLSPGAPCSSTIQPSLPCALPTCPPPYSGGPSVSSPAPKQCLATSLHTALSSDRQANVRGVYDLWLSLLWISVCCMLY